MIWRNIIKKLIVASLPIVFPLIAVALIISHFGFTIESLMAVIFLAEVYIIWAQLEVALRQTRLSTLEYEPEFGIAKREVGDSYEIEVKNLGKHMARNVFISIDLKLTDTKLPPKLISNIASGELVHVCSVRKEVLDNSEVAIELSYENTLGESGWITFVKDPKLPEFVARTIRGMPGILLNSFEELILLMRLFTWRRKVKRRG